MRALSEPLLPQNQPSEIEKPSLRHTSELLWRAARPRTARDGLLLVTVVILLIVSKVLALALPLTMRQIVNRLSSDDGSGLPATALVAVFCTLAIGAEGCVQLQEAAWARCFYLMTQRVSVVLFKHLHALSMRWHLHRKTGEVLTVVNQGVGAVGNLLQIVTFQIAGTTLELLLTSAVFFQLGVPAISVCVIAGASLYTSYTILLTQRLSRQRREQNTSNRESQELVVDSLINYETVKLCASEGAEALRFCTLTRELARLQMASQDSLSWLNWGQVAWRGVAWRDVT